jgi:FKBP-type peptidyl-prolyl cis-trans isomerase 2
MQPFLFLIKSITVNVDFNHSYAGKHTCITNSIPTVTRPKDRKFQYNFNSTSSLNFTLIMIN